MIKIRKTKIIKLNFAQDQSVDLDKIEEKLKKALGKNVNIDMNKKNYSKLWFIAPILFSVIGGLIACAKNHNHDDFFRTRECWYRRIAWILLLAWFLVGFMIGFLAG